MFHNSKDYQDSGENTVRWCLWT